MAVKSEVEQQDIWITDEIVKHQWLHYMELTMDPDFPQDHIKLEKRWQTAVDPAKTREFLMRYKECRDIMETELEVDINV